MKPFYSDESVTLHHGDALDVLRQMPAASVDAVVTDPPYGLAELPSRVVTAALTAWLTGDREHVPDGRGGFMGRSWDAFVPPPAVWDECLRVLKPGGHLLAFAGSRTADLMGMSIRLAGFEIRDGIDWIYGQGWPKSLNLDGGLGTALKPAREPIVVARKPLVGTVAANVLEYGTGALNIAGCRTATSDDLNGGAYSANGRARPLDGDERTGTSLGMYEAGRAAHGSYVQPAGRWPTNVVLSHAASPNGTDLCGNGCVPGCPVAELDAQSGVLTSGTNAVRTKVGSFMEHGGLGKPGDIQTTYGDTGGASRYFPVFRYEAKAPTAERPRTADGTAHPTVKPLSLIRFLVRLVTPKGGIVLDPFAGSGTTAEACVLEGFRCITVERWAAYLPLIVARLAKPLQPALDFSPEAA